jgi:hypothetical protein
MALEDSIINNFLVNLAVLVRMALDDSIKDTKNSFFKVKEKN